MFSVKVKDLSRSHPVVQASIAMVEAHQQHGTIEPALAQVSELYPELPKDFLIAIWCGVNAKDRAGKDILEEPGAPMGDICEQQQQAEFDEIKALLIANALSNKDYSGLTSWPEMAAASVSEIRCARHRIMQPSPVNASVFELQQARARLPHLLRVQVAAENR